MRADLQRIKVNRCVITCIPVKHKFTVSKTPQLPSLLLSTKVTRLDCLHFPVSVLAHLPLLVPLLPLLQTTLVHFHKFFCLYITSSFILRWSRSEGEPDENLFLPSSSLAFA